MSNQEVIIALYKVKETDLPWRYQAALSWAIAKLMVQH